jgi:hypothetical protein
VPPLGKGSVLNSKSLCVDHVGIVREQLLRHQAVEEGEGKRSEEVKWRDEGSSRSHGVDNLSLSEPAVVVQILLALEECAHR